MKTTSAVMASVASVIAAASLSVVSQPTASADPVADPNSHQLGSQASLTNGNVVQGWTVSSLQPSKDTIPYAVQGTLWEATASDEAIQGSAIPIVSNLSARAASGETYRVLYQVATPQGVNPATLAQGQKTTGKLYFDVIGDKPTSVVYTDGNTTLASWTQPTGGAPARAQSVGAPAPASTAPAPGASASPVAAGNPGAPLASGSQGTPLPSGSQGTPLPADTPATAAPAAGNPAESPAPAGPAPASPAPGAPAPVGGSPAQPPAPASPAPASPAPGAPAPASPSSAAPVPAPAANGGAGAPAGSPAPSNNAPTS